MRIFKPVWHTPGTYEFCKLTQRGHEIVLWESGSRICRWKDTMRPRPRDVQWTDSFDEIFTCDVAVMHLGHWTNVRPEFTKIQKAGIPRIVHLHSNCCNDSQKKLVTGEIAIVNSPAAKIAWGPDIDSTVCLSSVDVAEWPEATGRRRVVTDFRKGRSPMQAKVRKEIEIDILKEQSWAKYKAALGDASIYVMLNRIQNFPRARIEAMACGLCVVSVSPAGEGQVYNDGGQMIIVRSAKQAIRDIKFLMAHPSVARRIGRAARGFVEKVQTLDRWLDGVEGLLQKAIEGKT